jgi:hypothetical protein
MCTSRFPSRLLPQLSLAALLLLPLCSSCDDEIATSIDAQPTFSTDTLKMGTLLAETSSKTFRLMAYNRTSDILRLSSISLREGAESGFRMNVDGMVGTEFTNANLLRIEPHDSLFIFVEATLPASGRGRQTYEAHIDFACNGAVQSVVLTADCKDVLKLYGVTLTEDQRWERTSEVQVYDSLVIAPGVTLTLEDSVTLYLHDKTDIVVYGTLRALGRDSARVTLRGDRTDNMFDNLPYDNLPSQWGNLYFRSESRGNLLEWTDVRGMTDGIRVEAAAVDTTLSDPRLTFRSCRLKNSDGSLILAHSADMVLENCELSNAAGSLLELYGGAYDIVHCTLANYNFAASISKEAVYLSNFDTTTYTLHPLYRCLFANTLIWSRIERDRYSDVYPDFLKVAVPDGEFYDPRYQIRYDSIFHYRFDHCLLHAQGTDDNDFIQTLWNVDPKFRLIDAANYSYDFRPSAESPIIGAGSTDYTSRCPRDLDGRQRPATGNSPTIGCYEYYTE